MLSALGNVVYRAHGGRCPEQEQTCAVCMEDLKGRVIYLHCGHSFCLQPCFVQLIDYDHTKCPLCNTPVVVISPSLTYLRAMSIFIVDPDKAQKRSDRIDRLNQFRMIHDGDTREILMKLHGGVPDDFLEQTRKACRTCKFKRSKNTKQSEALSVRIESENGQRTLQTTDALASSGIDHTALAFEQDDEIKYSSAESRGAMCGEPGEARMCTGLVSSSLQFVAVRESASSNNYETGLTTREQRQHIPLFAPGVRDHHIRFQECFADHSTRSRESNGPIRENGWLQITDEERQDTPMFLPGVQDHYTSFCEATVNSKSSL